MPSRSRRLRQTIRRAFLEGQSEVTRHGLRRNPIGIVSNDVRRAYARAYEEVASVLRAEAMAAAKRETARMGLRVDMVFDPSRFNYAEARAAELLTTMASEQRSLLVLSNRYTATMSPNVRADVLNSIAGLNARQAQAVLNYRSGLSDGELSDKQIRQRIDAYADRLRSQRLTMIESTELTVAENVGKEQAWRSLELMGLIPGAYRVWVTALDERTCPTCSALDGTTAPLTGSWDATGTIVYTPGLVHPQCRCTEELIVPARKAA